MRTCSITRWGIRPSPARRSSPRLARTCWPAPTRQAAWLHADADAALDPEGRGREPEPPLWHGLHRRPYLYDHRRGGCAGPRHALRGCARAEHRDLCPLLSQYKPYIEGAGLTLRVTPPRCADFQIDFEAFAQLVDENTAAVLINSPNNPSGTAYSEATLRQLADFLTEASRQVRPPHLPAVRRAVPRDRVRRRRHAPTLPNSTMIR